MFSTRHVCRGLLAALILLSIPFSVGLAGPYSGLVMEPDTDRVLYSQAADELRHPASLTKMMTLLMVFEALEQGRLRLNEPLYVSSFAVSRPPSKLGLRTGETITAEEGILGLVTQSANDAATVLAEALGGSESNFAFMMTQKARQIGMSDTVFRNASGLPDPDQVTTARDMYRLAKTLLRQYPQYYGYFSTDRFFFRNRSFHNHNHLLETYPGTDGIKTGFVNASGYNLVASAKRNGVRLVGVVFGGDSYPHRDALMRRLLDDGFAQIEGQESSMRWVGADGSNPFRPLLRQPADNPIAERLDARREALRERKVALAATPKTPLPAPTKAKGKTAAAPTPKLQTVWQVRVGEFGQESAAEQRLGQAMKAAPKVLNRAKGAVAKRALKGKKSYVAYFKGLTREEAATACNELRRRRLECSLAAAG